MDSYDLVRAAEPKLKKVVGDSVADAIEAAGGDPKDVDVEIELIISITPVPQSVKINVRLMG